MKPLPWRARLRDALWFVATFADLIALVVVAAAVILAMGLFMGCASNVYPCGCVLGPEIHCRIGADGKCQCHHHEVSP